MTLETLFPRCMYLFSSLRDPSGYRWMPQNNSHVNKALLVRSRVTLELYRLSNVYQQVGIRKTTGNVVGKPRFVL